MRVQPRARRVGVRLGHERGHVAVAVRQLLDRVLEREAAVGAAHPPRGHERQLPLRAGVLAVRRHHLDAVRVQLLDQLLDEGHVRVPADVEDLVAVEQLLVVGVQHVELGLHPDQRVVAERVGPLQLAPEHAPRQRLEGRAVRPLRVADPARGGVGPGHHGGGRRVGDQQLVAVGDLLVVQRPADHIRPAVQHGNAAVHVQPGLRVAVGAFDRHHLAAAGAVHVRQLEPDEADALRLPAVEHARRRRRACGGCHPYPSFAESGVPLSHIEMS